MLRWKLDERRAHKEHAALRKAGAPLPQDLRGHEMQFAFDRAFFAYVVQPYDGEVVLFRAEHESRTRFVRDRELGWNGFPRGGVRVVDCPGDHFSMCTEPNVQVLCAKMTAEIDRVIGRAAAGG
jgi:thioesterase domain-containing protein